MRKTRIVALAGALTMVGGCRDFLDVNTNPNAPEEVAANLYLPQMLHWAVAGSQWDGRFIARYTQQLRTTTHTNWDRMGYDPGSDNAGQIWRDVYWSFGQNLLDMMDIAAEEERWDILGLGYILKAWGWHQATAVHGEIIVKEAIDQTKFSFNYDSQQFVYEEVRRLLDSAIVLLNRTDGAVDAAYMARGDKVYNGDRTKWLKFAHGLMATNLNHYTNKGSYNPAAVIQHVDQSFTSNADDAGLKFEDQSPFNDARNFQGPTRGNFATQRQTQFVLNLMNGTQFSGAVDPRMTRMLSPAPDGQYRGLDPNTTGFGALTAAQQPNNPYGHPGTLTNPQLPGRYLFNDKVRHPAMTYSQLQFIKAEAAYRRGDRATALAAYVNGISSHIDFVNTKISEGGHTDPPISAAEKAAFLANPAIVPTAAGLTLTHILSQKYIAQWAWGHVELWMDMRRYRYTNIDPASGRQVFPGFAPPTTLYAANAGKLVYRIRPRFNSEYVWNRPALDAIGGLADDYHTKPMWIIEP